MAQATAYEVWHLASGNLQAVLKSQELAERWVSYHYEGCEDEFTILKLTWDDDDNSGFVVDDWDYDDEDEEDDYEEDED